MCKLADLALFNPLDPNSLSWDCISKDPIAGGLL